MYKEQLEKFIQYTETSCSFYDARHQPRADIKRDISSYCAFVDIGFALMCSDHNIMGNEREMGRVLKEQGYTHAMPYCHGGTAMTYIIKKEEDENQDWHILRGWTRLAGYKSGERSVNPVVLQPIQTLELSGHVPPLEILPFVNIMHFRGLGIGGSGELLHGFFNDSGVEYESLTDMGVLPTGQIVFVDPGHAHGSDDVNEASMQIKETTQRYRQAASAMGIYNCTVFDYVQPNNEWTQRQSFPQV